MSNQLPIRPEFINKKPYGAPQLDVPVRLNTNENPYPHGKKFIQAVSQRLIPALENANRYPDRDAIELRAALASYLTKQTGVRLTGEQIWAANGSNEVLLQLCQLFGGPNRFAIGFEPSYSMHSAIAELTHTKWIAVSRDENYDIDGTNLPNELAAAHLVFVCTPNNPTGNTTDLGLITKIYQMTKGIVVVDEAYAEFSNTPSAITLLASHPRIAVVRTMSKAFGFAGIRLGYIAASTEMISALQLVRLPYHLSTLTQQAALAALTDSGDLDQQVDELKNQRELITQALRQQGLTVIDSNANFVLFGKFSDQTKVWQFLLDKGVLIRDVGISGWLRVTCGTPTENERFIAAIGEYLASNSEETQ